MKKSKFLLLCVLTSLFNLSAHAHEGHEMPEFMKNMTQEERQEYRKGMRAAMEKMTPEERKAFREQMQKQMHGEGGHNHGDGEEHHCQHKHNHDDENKPNSKK